MTHSPDQQDNGRARNRRVAAASIKAGGQTVHMASANPRRQIYSDRLSSFINALNNLSLLIYKLAIAVLEYAMREFGHFCAA
jgi:hypothetical protein